MASDGNVVPLARILSVTKNGDDVILITAARRYRSKEGALQL